MKLTDFPHLSNETLLLECFEDISQLPSDVEVKLFKDNDDLYLQYAEKIVLVHIPDANTRFELLLENPETLWLLCKKRTNQLFLQYLSAVESTPLTIDIGVSEKIVEDLLNKDLIPNPNMSSACNWLRHDFFLPILPEETLNRLVIAKHENSVEGNFLVFGKGWKINIHTNKSGKSLIKNITRIKSFPTSVSIVYGNIQFKDFSLATLMMSSEQRALLETSLRDNGDYLKLWQNYNDLEWQRASSKAKQLGVLRYDGKKVVDAEVFQWALSITNEDKLKEFREQWNNLELAGGDLVEVSEYQPDWENEEVNTDKPKQAIRGKISFKKNTVLITLNEDRRHSKPTEKGYVFLSLAGQASVKRRRETARASIQAGQRLPQLQYLLEGVSTPVIKRKLLKPLTVYAKELFHGKPTDKQEEALKIALNTSDIAIIVGPPGTGKTQVISALQRRLIEESKNSSIQHQILVSSYQHDAVDNALSRSDVYGLPAWKVGGKQGNKKETVIFDEWCKKRRKTIAENLPELEKNEPHVALLDSLNTHIVELRLGSLSEVNRHKKLLAINEVLEALKSERIRISALLLSDWNEYVESSQSAKQIIKSPDKLLRKTRALRTESKSYCDDGADRAYDLNRQLSRISLKISADEKELLETASDSDELSALQLKQLNDLKNYLLKNLLPDYRPLAIKRRLNNQGISLLNRIENELAEKTQSSSKGIVAIVRQYHDALEFSPRAAQRTAKEYASVVGATCQQAAGNEMSSLKAVNHLDTNAVEFNTVMIDEAARANPLDLFVPMSMANRRIILVGDDRQLPHILEPEIEEELSEIHQLSKLEQEAYRKSLFEVLRKNLEALEKKDGIKRVVILDTQFRMHPILGDFVSRNFYESEGMPEIKSGRPASDFIHNIKGYEDSVAAWLDIPLNEGFEDKNQRTKSTYREVEARKISIEVKRLLSTSDKSLSIGVITFYSAQREKILDEMVKQDLYIHDESGYQIHEDYLVANKNQQQVEARLTVGTVDAFQGKEFDVVFLSMVRANTKSDRGKSVEAELKEKFLNQKYGHLRLNNRMNVAMSRQRKLLIVVGAKSMAQGDDAQAAIPALVDFLNLCGGENGCIL